MSWRVRMVPPPKTSDDYRNLQIGDAWRPDERAPPLWQEVAAAHFGRAPLLVKLPCGTFFNVYGHGWKDGKPTAFSWTVTGTPPCLTLTPSVNIGGGWHGMITGGVIQDDVTGKKFE